MLPIKSASKDILMAAARACVPHLHECASILMYHSVGDNKAFFTVSPEAFEEQLRYILTKKYSTIFLSELIRKIQNKESISNTVVLTFDDAYLDNYEKVLPLLKKYKIPMTLSVPTGLLGQKFTTSENVSLPLISEQQVKEMIGSGFVEIIPHTHTHTVLTHISEELAEKEIDRSRHEIEKMTGEMPTIFSYPKGKYNLEIIQHLKKTNFVAAVSVREGVVSHNDDLFTLHRNSIDSSTTFIQFKTKISQGIALYEKLKSIL